MGNAIAGYQATLYYVAEVTEGTTPTDPAYLNLSQRTEVSVSQQPSPNIVALSGSVDNADIQKGVENPILSFTLNPNKNSAQDFLKTFASTDSSFTLLLKIQSPDITFARVTGCKVKRMGNSVTVYPNATPLEVTFEIWGWTIEFTDGIGTGSLEAVDSTVINWADCTVEKDDVPITDWWTFNFSIDNDIFRERSSAGVTTCLKRGRRAVSGQWTRSASDTSFGTTELNEAKLATAIKLEFIIVADIYLFDNSANQEVTVAHPITDLVGIQQDFIVGQLTLP